VAGTSFSVALIALISAKITVRYYGTEEIISRPSSARHFSSDVPNRPSEERLQAIPPYLRLRLSSPMTTSRDGNMLAWPSAVEYA
jgi:hypothetical protein